MKLSERKIFCLLLCLFGMVGVQAQNIEKLAPYGQGDSWKGVASMAIHGDHVYVLFTADNNRGRIFSYNLATGERASSEDLFETISKDDRSHNDAAIAVDGDGYIHAWIGMHNHRMKYFRSLSPGSINDFENFSQEMPGYLDGGVNEKRYTYPRACTSANGDVFLILRRTGMFYDENRKKVRESQHHEKQDLYHWENKTKKWSVDMVKAKPGFNAYLSHIFADGANSVHMVTAWSWFHDGSNTFQRGTYLRYSIEDHTYFRADGGEVLVPVNVDNPDADLFYDGEYPWEKERAEIQVPRVCVNENGQPVVAYSYTPDNAATWLCHIALWNGSEWKQTKDVLGAFQYQYERPEITCTGGRYNIYVSGKLVSASGIDFTDTDTVTYDDNSTVEAAITYDGKTDLVLTRRSVYKVTYP